MSETLFDGYGRIRLDSDQLADLLYQNLDLRLEDFSVTNPAEYNTAIEFFHLPWAKLRRLNYDSQSIEEFDKINQNQWFMPNFYQNLDIEQWLRDKCTNEDQLKRVDLELTKFNQYNMINVLKYLKYLVDTLIEHNIVWGVGRGSSVASYCLYLIGIHRIDSIKFDLDINEFLK